MTLFLDLDGPVLDVAARYHAVHRSILADSGLACEDLPSYWDQRRAGRSEADLLREAGMSDRQIEACRSRRSAMLEAEEFIRLDRPWPEVAAILPALARRLPIVIVTLRRHGAPAISQLASIGVMEHLTGFVHRSTRSGTSKSQAVREAGYAPRAGDWFCGDTGLEIDAAFELGIGSCAVSFGMTSSERLSELHPDLLLDSPKDLANWLERLA